MRLLELSFLQEKKERKKVGPVSVGPISAAGGLGEGEVGSPSLTTHRLGVRLPPLPEEDTFTALAKSIFRKISIFIMLTRDTQDPTEKGTFISLPNL